MGAKAWPASRDDSRLDRSSERGRKLVNQLEFQPVELEENASQDETAAELQAADAPCLNNGVI